MISEVVLGFVVYRHKKRAGAEKHSSSREEEGITSRSNSDDSITLKHKEGVGTQRGSYVVHAPVTTDIPPMTPTGYESSAYTAIGYAQPSSQPQPQVYNSVGATPVIDGSMYCTTQDIPLQHNKSTTSSDCSRSPSCDPTLCRHRLTTVPKPTNNIPIATATTTILQLDTLATAHPSLLRLFPHR